MNPSIKAKIWSIIKSGASSSKTLMTDSLISISPLFVLTNFFIERSLVKKESTELLYPYAVPRLLIGRSLL